jgi:hypothetical protein
MMPGVEVGQCRRPRDEGIGLLLQFGYRYAHVGSILEDQCAASPRFRKCEFGKTTNRGEKCSYPTPC